MFIAYKQDKNYSIWTDEKPIPMVFQSIVNLAKQTETVIMNRFMNFENPDYNLMKKSWKTLFKSRSEYDVVITLKKDFLPRFFQNIEYKDSNINQELEQQLNSTLLKQYKKYKKVRSYKNLQGNVSSGLLVDFDPAEIFYNSLKERYYELGLVFLNKYGGYKIGIIWNPSKFLFNTFKLRQSVSTMPIHLNDEIKFIPNIFQIVSDIRIMGKGIIEDITI